MIWGFNPNDTTVLSRLNEIVLTKTGSITPMIWGLYPSDTTVLSRLNEIVLTKMVGNIN